MPDRNLRVGKFVNCREWQGFLRAAQCAASYPRNAVQSGRAWFSERAASSSHWLAVNRMSVQR